MSGARLEPPPVTVTRPGEPPRDGPHLSRPVPRWLATGVLLLTLAVLLVLNAHTAERERRDQLPPAAAARTGVFAVRTDDDGVLFGLRLQNVSGRPFTLLRLAGDGMALSVAGGLPVIVPAHSATELDVTIQLPGCRALPSALAASHRPEPFVPFALRLAGEHAVEGVVPVWTEPSAPLHRMLRAFAAQVCPRS